jgi:hypothetical protein
MTIWSRRADASRTRWGVAVIRLDGVWLVRSVAWYLV